MAYVLGKCANFCGFKLFAGKLFVVLKSYITFYSSLDLKPMFNYLILNQNQLLFYVTYI